MRQMTLVAFLQAQNCTNFVGSWRHPEASPGLHDRRLLPPHRPRARGRQVPCRLLRRSPGDAGPLRRRSCAHRRQRHPLREDGPDHHPDRDGHGDRTAGSWLDLLHHLLRAVPRRARVPDAGPDDQRSRRLEHRHLDERRRGAEHGPRRAWRARPALRPRRRIPGSRRRPLGLLGRRRDRAGQADRPVRASRQGAAAGSCRRILPLARAVHRAAFRAGPSGADPGGTERPRPSLRRTLGRAGVRQLPLAGAGAGGLRRVQAADRRGGTRSGEGGRRRRRLYSGRRDARRGRGQGGADRQRCRRRSISCRCCRRC